MEAILKFNLPEDRIDYRLANKAFDLAMACNEYDQALRKIIKYNNDLDDKTIEVYEKARDLFRMVLDDNNIILDSLFE